MSTKRPAAEHFSTVNIADLVAPGIAAIHPYEPGKPIDEVERELGITGVVKLASNENPLGPSPRAVEAVASCLTQLHLYPDGASFHLRRKLAAHLDVAPEEIALGNGSNEIIDLLVRAFCGPGDDVVFPSQTFVCYGLSAQAHGIAHVEAPRASGFAYDVDAILSAITSRTKIVFLANPDNPTGVHLGRRGMERLCDELPARVLLAVDEAYLEYVRAGDALDLLAYRRGKHARPTLVLLRTFSKIYGLAGLRCGYAVTSREIAGYLHRVRNAFNVSTVAQVGAAAALDDAEHVARARATNAAEMDVVTAGLDRLGLPWTPSQANFVLVDVSPRGGRDVFNSMLRRGVIVRPLANYRLPHHLRITIGTPDENRRMLEALAAVLAA